MGAGVCNTVWEVLAVSFDPNEVQRCEERLSSSCRESELSLGSLFCVVSGAAPVSYTHLTLPTILLV
eukprot:3031993-Pleurochrysis_carterae.AAC.1